MNLSEKIVDLRKKKGLSQEELAEILNVSRQTISRWEVGTALPDAINLIQLSKVFEVSADFLLNDEFENDGDLPAVKKVKMESEKINLKTSVILFVVGFCLLLFDFYYYKITNFDLLPDFIGWILVLIGLYLIKEVNILFKKSILFSILGIIISTAIMLLRINGDFIELQNTGVIGIAIGLFTGFPFIVTVILIALGIKTYTKNDNALIIIFACLITFFEISLHIAVPLVTKDQSGLIAFFKISDTIAFVMYIVFVFLELFNHKKE